jgi:hypothetical protein
MSAWLPILRTTWTNVLAMNEGTIDPALAGRDLGPWHMIPAAVSVPIACVLAIALLWYFARLGRSDVPVLQRRVRRTGIVFALAALVPLVRALTFVHPHEDRVAWATAWSVALLALVLWFLLAIVDVILVLRGGIREYSELKREVFGGGKSAPGDGRNA